jgi:hypothetical protein
MSTSRAAFHSRDPNPHSIDTNDPSNKNYMGEERRKQNRRDTMDRRGDIRFELLASDRRENTNRRETDRDHKFW